MAAGRDGGKDAGKGGDPRRGEMPFLDHLEELRWRIFKILAALVVATLVGFLLVHYFSVLELLIRPVRPFLPEGRLAFFSPATPFFLVMKLSVLAGLILASPVVIYQIWAFLAPALEDQERNVIIPSLYLGLMLFALGVAMAYFIALPVSLRFFFGLQTDFLVSVIGADEYLAFVVRLLLAFGLIFELPVVVMILTALGLATPAFLREKRRHAIVLITVTASFLSPGDVIMLTVLMMVPLVLLYELSILLSGLVYRSRQQKRILDPSGPPEGTVEMK